MALAGNHGHAGGARLDKNVERLLSEPWGAAKAGVHYNKETLASLCDEFARLEPQARRGALQGTLFMRQSQRESLHEEVRHLVNLAVDDKDQWASLIARALGGLKERFDLQQLQQDVPAVADALASIRKTIQVEGTPDTYRPLEEMYLSPRLLAAAGAPLRDAASEPHAHFTLRTRREPKRRLAGSASQKTLAQSTSHGSDLAARATVAQPIARRPASSAAASMFAPPSRKPSPSFLRDSGPTRRPAGGAAAKSMLSNRGRESSTKTMMIDVSEAAQLGTVKGEDLLAEEAQKEKLRAQQERELKRKQEQDERELKRKQEQDERQRRIQRMMEEREAKKKLEADRKRAREEEMAKRKAEMAAKRMRTEAPREEVGTPSPKEEPIHGF